MARRRIQTVVEEKDVNPKLAGSGLTDCIPQTGQCPNKCLECIYNHPGFYRTKSESLFPPYDTTKLVRVNCGHDSNIYREFVIDSTSKYKEKFYNTSLPNFDFPGPVVFTCNGRDTDFSAMMVTKNLDNLMAVRFRTNLWNLDLMYEVIAYYALKKKIPVTITFMRYADVKNIPKQFLNFYVYRKSILNEYYILDSVKQDEVFENYAHEFVGACGKGSSFCRDCGRCKKLYNDWKVKRGFKAMTSVLYINSN